MFRFVSEVVRDFWSASALEQVGFLLSLAGLSTFFGAFISRFRLRNSRAQIDQMRKDAVALATERERAERRAAAERARAEAWMPDSWIKQAQKERSEGNEEQAIRALEEGFERLRPGLARTSLALAGHHLSMIVGADPPSELAQADRLARIASLLDPQDPDGAFLVEDVELVRAHGDLEQISELPRSLAPTDQAQAAALADAIAAEAERFANRGLPRIALRLFRRALLVASRGGVGPRRNWLGPSVQDRGESARLRPLSRSSG